VSELTTLALDEFTRYVDDELAKYPDGTEFRAGGRKTKQWPDGENLDWWREDGPEQIKGYIQWRENNPNLELAVFAGKPAVEVEVSAVIHDTLTLRGFIDRVFLDTNTNTYLIVDLKTGRNSPPSPLQLAFYRLALRDTLGVDVPLGAYYMSRKNSLGPIFDLWYPRDVIVDWLTKARILIDNDLFVPHLTSMCGSCGVKDYCYAYNPLVPAPFSFTPDSNTTEMEVTNE